MAKTTQGLKEATDRQVRAERRNKVQGRAKVSDAGKGSSLDLARRSRNVTREVSRKLLFQSSDWMNEEYFEGNIFVENFK